MLKRLRSLKSILHDSVDFTVDLVEGGHESTARNVMGALRLFAPTAVPLPLIDELRRLATTHTLGSVRSVNRAVQRLTDTGLDAAVATGLLAAAGPVPQALPMRSDLIGSSAWLTDAAIGALNGIAGDYLHRAHNALDLGFSLRLGDDYLALDTPAAPATPPQPGAAPPPDAILLPAVPRLAIFLHGLATTEWSWCWDALAYHGDASSQFGSLLLRDLGITPAFARYNSGRRVFENGRLLAEGLERLFQAQPGAFPGEILLIGHSMGGLVARSACHQAEAAGHAWVQRVSRVLCLGSPHQGAPLEKLGHLLTNALSSIDVPATRIPAEILRRRSAGIRDLRHGTIAEESWTAVPPLRHIAYHFVSATVTRDLDHPLGWLIGDVLVRTPSASGPVLSKDTLRIETKAFGGIVHHQLQNHPDVYTWLRQACEIA